ncbi:MAG: DUF3291 domain-containing protein [Acidobacteria bacterium]|nr:DUF3291 domain-containing protein [Acidobacteriota bacterium]
MSFISLTRLRIRSWRFLPMFFYYAVRTLSQAKKAPGNVSAIVLNDANRVFWTMSVWTDEQAMRAYMISGAHGKVMPKLMEWCDEAATAHWTQESATAPSWLEAHQKLITLGRRSKVRHPSAAQEAFAIPTPRK